MKRFLLLMLIVPCVLFSQTSVKLGDTKEVALQKLKDQGVDTEIIGIDGNFWGLIRNVYFDNYTASNLSIDFYKNKCYSYSYVIEKNDGDFTKLFKKLSSLYKKPKVFIDMTGDYFGKDVKGWAWKYKDKSNHQIEIILFEKPDKNFMNLYYTDKTIEKIVSDNEY